MVYHRYLASLWLLELCTGWTVARDGRCGLKILADGSIRTTRPGKVVTGDFLPCWLSWLISLALVSLFTSRLGNDALNPVLWRLASLRLIVSNKTRERTFMTERRYAVKSAYVKMNHTERYHFLCVCKNHRRLVRKLPRISEPCWGHWIIVAVSMIHLAVNHHLTPTNKHDSYHLCAFCILYTVLHYFFYSPDLLTITVITRDANKCNPPRFPSANWHNKLEILPVRSHWQKMHFRPMLLPNQTHILHRYCLSFEARLTTFIVKPQANARCCHWTFVWPKYDSHELEVFSRGRQPETAPV